VRDTAHSAPMDASRAASVAALLSGLVWVVAGVLDWGGDVNPVVYSVGLVGLVIAFAAFGYTLVDHAPVWLRAVVSVATPALAYMVWVAISDAFASDYLPVLAAGAVLVLVGVVGLARGRAERAVAAPVRGRRAAR
jgi:hypothetical protein